MKFQSLLIGALFILNFKNMMASKIKEEEITYMSEGVTCKGFVAYDENIKGKRPAVLVVPEWWGCNDYTRRRARELAELGYIAMAVDMYGEGKVADNPDKAKESAMPFYQNPEMGNKRILAAEEKIKTYPQCDANKVAAIGYCFGGSMVLNSAKSGSDFKGVVSFHGGLAGVPAKSGVLKSKILVCHGGADKFVSAEDVSKFKSNLDEVKAYYIFKEYPGATHAFSNPDADANAKKFGMPIAYNAKADKESWEEMKKFLKRIFS